MNISKASLSHCLSELKKYVYDDDKKKALSLIDDMNKQLSISEYNCERCNAEIAADDWACGGSMCERCFAETNDVT